MDAHPPLCLQVLVVDGVESSRNALSAMVLALGHEVVVATDGGSALTWLGEHRVDVVLLELLMPGMGGFEVCGRIRVLLPDNWVPVIVCTSSGGDDRMIDALTHGADDFLVKPIPSALLNAKLRHYGRILGLQLHLSMLAQRQRDIQDNILDAVLTLDEREDVIDANLAACQAFSDGTPIGFVGQDVCSATGSDLKGLLSCEKLDLKRGDGGHFAAEVSASRWNESGRARTTLVVRDLTVQRRNERMRDEFLATVSHELRTPLTSVLGAIALLASGTAGALPPQAIPLAAVAQRNGERLSKLIDDILDLTKLEGDRMVMNLRPQLLAPLLLEAVAANQGYADRSGVRLQGDFGSEGTVNIVEVRVDSDRFLQVMANLLSNAIKHSPRGAEVIVRTKVVGHGQSVAVCDSGPGIDPRFRGHLFEKFSQADASDRRAVGGTGLGLYIARLLVDRMGGRIGVEPDTGSGATFNVWLPFAAGGASRRPMRSIRSSGAAS
jgi:signal transduction histidine kinase